MSKVHPGLGINVVIKHEDKASLKKYIDILQSIEVEWIRLEINFFKPIPDDILIFFVTEVHKAGIKILGLLTGLVPGTLINCVYPSFKYKNPLDDLENYLLYVEKNIVQFKNYIQYWEIWNEANTLRFWINKPNPKEYFKLVKETSPLIKKISPNSVILLGGIMSDDLHSYAPFQKVNFLKNCLDLGIDDYIDIYNFHPYIPACYFSLNKANHYETEVKKAIDGYLNFYSDISKPHWITEFGICPLWVSINQSEIGQLYRSLYEFSRQREIPFFIWTLTDFKDPEYSKFNPETSFGIVDFELKPKELLVSLNKSFLI
jgi:hypothetical protein